MIRSWLALVVLGSLVAACDATTRGTEGARAENSAAALQVIASGELDVQRYPDLKPLEPRDAGTVVCGTLRCFAFYALNGYLYAARLSKTGVADHRPTLVGYGNGVFTAAAHGDDFVVISGSVTGRRATRMRGSDGVVVRDFSVNLPAADAYRLAGNGTSWLLVYSNGYTHRAVVKSLDTFADIGTPVLIPGFGAPRVIPGDGQYLLHTHQALRISGSTGAPLDGAWNAFTRYTDVSWEPVGAYKNGVYQLAWTTGSGEVLGLRIRASDGVLLDAIDDFNQTNGANVLISGQATSGMRFANVLPDSVLVSWQVLGTSEIRGVRVNVATGERINPDLIFVLGAPWPTQVFFNADWGLAVSGTTVAPLIVGNAPVAFSYEAGKPAAVASYSRYAPRVASNGTTFFIAWGEQAPNFEGTSWRGTRINATTGAYLDDPPLVLGDGQYADVAARGTDYLVALTTGDGISPRFVSSSGALGPALPTIATGFATRPRLVWNGRYFLLTWNIGDAIRGVRLKADGTTLDALPLVIATATASSYDTVADTTPALAERTFLTLWGNAGRARRLRSESGVLIEPVTELAAAPFGGVATDGTRVVAAFTYSGQVRATFVDMNTGLAASNPGIELVRLPQSRSFTELWHDGKSYSIMTSELTAGSSTRRYALQRFDVNLAPLDSALPGGSTFIAPEHDASGEQHDVAADGQGHSLFAFVRWDGPRVGAAVKAHLITNDGLASNGVGGAAGHDGGVDAGGAGVGGSTGGSSGSGGVAGSTGGNSGNGGAAGSTGGNSGNGGAAGSTGGNSGVGGVAGAGGSAGQHGFAGNAGASGATGSGGSSGAAAQGRKPSNSSDDGGCGCHLAPWRGTPASTWLAVLGAVIALCRRRDRNARWC
ncbi:MAG TPA: hypothetical protein VI072_30790 [Polyangiaceae bacterium]